MHPFRDIAIKRKLMLITMSTSGVALLLACLAFVVYEMIIFRGSMVDKLATTAAMVGDNSSAALTFGDPSSAEQTLKSLAADPHIRAAAIYTPDGKLFARYPREWPRETVDPSQADRDGHRFTPDSLLLFHQFKVAGQVAGSVYLRSDLEEMRARLRQYSVIVVLVMSLASLVAFLLSRTLQSAISRPISHLAGVVRVVGDDKNYAVRAVKQGDDELGQLIDGFNQMLREIQHRDTALQAARDGLEQRVDERTRDLQREIERRANVERALRLQEERTRLIVDKAFDAIVSTDAAGKVLAWNTQAEAVFGWSAAEAMGHCLAELIVPPDSRNADNSECAWFAPTGAASAVNRRIEVTAVRKDGQTIPVEIAVTPICVDSGSVFNAFLRDITERKMAEADLTAAHKQLVEISREAGMAEVATDVLHNVGNVLNSANVSATLLSESLQRSQASDLGEAVAVLRTHAHDLGEFVTNHPQGKHFTAFLESLDRQLAAERKAVMEELGCLRGSIEHIKEIVAMQQSYAKIAGVPEEIRVTELVEESLRLNGDALARDGIEIVREYEAAPLVNIDKHKALQILVNLVCNAKHACVESGREERRLLLRVISDADHVKIFVIDNGIGIKPENLMRIFNHGFTTRKTGHGFGLHSGALAARELGGSLSVHSDGPGCGAAFVLELPVRSAASVMELEAAQA